MLEGFFQKEPEKNSLQSEHLENIRPIIACLCDEKNLDPETSKVLNHITATGQKIDFYGDVVVLDERNIRNAGMGTYVISETNKTDKYSEEYANCTGIALVGTDKDTGEQISFLSHQNPPIFLDVYKRRFKKDLISAIRTHKERSLPGTVDAVIFGGNRSFFARDLSEYSKSIKMLSDICKGELSFEPTVLTGPNIETETGKTAAFLDTQNRRLYIVRPAQQSNKTNESYLAKDVKKNVNSGRWQKWENF